MQEQELEIGRIYFSLAYEDDNMKYPQIYSCVYMGKTIEGSSVHMFRFIGSDDTLELNETQLDLMMGLDELAAKLQNWAKNNPSISRL